MLKEADMYEYQKRASNAIVERPRLGEFLECGLGKTVIALTAVRKLLASGDVLRVLVVAPKSVADGVWQQEANKWEHLQSLRMSVISGTAKQRQQAMRNQADIYIVSRDNFAKVVADPDYRHCDMLILDESTSFKNASTKRWKALCRKNGKRTALLDDFQRVVLLTGTPVSESMAGIWAQMYILDRGERLGRTLTEFRTQYMYPTNFNGYPVWKDFRKGAGRVIERKISDICISMREKDYLQLPERIDIVRNTGYEPDSVYKAMQRDGVIRADEHVVMAGTPATKYGKLRQIASGAVYTELGQAIHIHDKKENAFRELVEDIGENVLVFYQFDFERQFLEDCGAEHIESPEQQAKWNRGEIKLACAHPVSLGFGNNIQSGGSVIVWYTLPLSLEQYIQANKRLHRQGQKGSVRVYHMIGKGTIEETVYKLLTSQKAVTLEALMEYIKV